MRIQIVVLALAMGLAMGCATRFDEHSVTVVWGNASVTADCEDGDRTNCDDVISGGDLSQGFVGIVSKVIDTAVSVAGKFVPGGLDSGEPDTLRVEIVE